MLRIGHPHPPTPYHKTNSRILRPLQMGVSHPLGLWQTSRPGKKKIEASHRYKLTSLTSLNATVHQTVLFESSLHSLKSKVYVTSTKYFVGSRSKPPKYGVMPAAMSCSASEQRTKQSQVRLTFFRSKVHCQSCKWV